MAKTDPMALLQVAPSMIKAWWGRVREWFRHSLLGRIIWAARNVNKDFQTKVPEYHFELTTEQAQYVEKVMCTDDLRILKGLKAFYHKYPRGRFNLPPYGTGNTMEEAAEGAALAEAAMNLLYPPELKDGKKYFLAGNPFLKMIARQYEDMGGPGAFKRG